MLVFPPHFVQRLEERYSRTPDSRKPDFYWIATDEIYAQRRANIERWLGLVPNENRYKNQLIQNLRFEKHESAYNELFVGCILKQFGFDLEYSPLLTIPDGADHQTPDWYASNKDGSLAFYVEVFTPNPPKDRVKNERDWEELCEYIKNSCIGYGIQIHTEDNLPLASSLEQAKHKQKRIADVADKVKDWIISTSPEPDAHLYLRYETLDEIHELMWDSGRYIGFKVVERLIDHGWCGSPMYLYDISDESLAEAIKRKVDKYKGADELQETPFVLFPVPGTLSLYAHDDVEEILYGHTGLRVSDERTINLGDGLYNGKKPINSTLSAVVWLKWVRMTHPTTKKEVTLIPTVYFNPNAKNPLPENFLPFESLVCNEHLVIF